MATSTRTGPSFAALAIAIAIVGAVVLEPGSMARTPDVSTSTSRGSVSVGELVLSGALAAEIDRSALGPAGGAVDPASAVDLGGDPLHPMRGRSVPVDLAPGAEITLSLLGTPVDAPPKPQPETRPAAATPAPTPPPVKPAPKPKPNPKPAPQPRSTAWNVAPIVTWYGPGFYGSRTACGQRYTRHIVGVAHKTLPCGTLVQFRYHGITVTAPVIDRGPYASAAFVFDFSAALACDLFRERGQATGCFTRHDVQWRVVGRRS